MATGLVEFITQSGTPGSFGGNGNTIAKVIDGDVATRWDSPISVGAAGVDLGASGGTVTRWRYVAREDFETRMRGGSLRASNTVDGDGVVNGTVTTVETLPSATTFFPIYPNFYERSVSPGVTRRYWQFVCADSAFGSVSELQFLGAQLTGVNDRPAQPSITPPFGRYPEGGVMVTIDSLTTSATIYYTTDGSTPTTSSTLYSGPFFLPISGTTTFKAIAYDATCSTTTSLVKTVTYYGTGFVAGTYWDDDRGVDVQAHGGGIYDNTAVDGYYYWIGDFANDVSYYGTPGGGIGMYRSPDLYNWYFIDRILGLTDGVTTVGYTERPKLTFCDATGKFVIWAHVGTNHDTNDRAAVATADSITGPWTWQIMTLNPGGDGFKDMNLFVDDDASAYVIYTNGNNTETRIQKLASDYLNVTGSATVIVAGREAAAVFKRGSYYFCITTVPQAYNSNDYDTTYQTATSPLGAWSATTHLYSPEPPDDAFKAQSSFVLKIPGKIDGYVLGNDKWPGNSTSAQTWLPLSFPTDSTLSVATPSDWNLDYFEDASSVVGTRAWWWR